MNRKRVQVYSQKKGLKVILNQSTHRQEDPLSVNKHQNQMEGWEWLQQSFSQIWQRLSPVGRKIGWSLSKHPFLKKKKKPMSKNGMKLLLSIVGAILVGLAMGGALLQLFFSDQPARLSSIDSHLPKPSQTTMDLPPVMQEGSPIIPALKVFMLQAGNYTDRQGAQGKVKTLKAQGMMAVMSQRAPYRIFVGVGSSRDEALKLSFTHQVEMEIFLKEWSIGGGKLSIDGQSKEIQSTLTGTLQAGHHLLSQLSHLSTQQMGQGDKPVTKLTMEQKLFTQYQQWITNIRLLETKLPAQAASSLGEMERGMKKAIQSAKAAAQHPSNALWWQTQEGLIRYVMGFEQFTQSIE